MTCSNLAGGRLTIDLGALVANWRALDARSRPGRAAAVVKADAYGLGLHHAVPALRAAGCTEFFVALPEEGLAVRALAPDARVFVLNGVHTQSVETFRANGLIPVLSTSGQADLWAAHGGGQPACLQVDTGMNRLGLGVAEALDLAARQRVETAIQLVHVMSHFACADGPDDPMNDRQRESFQAVADAFAGVESSLCNSAGTLTGGAMGFALSRPGIALYGAEAVDDLPNPMHPVVTLEGRIVQVKTVPEGQAISYGAAERLTRETRVATVSVGYADGYPRSASGAGVPLRETGLAGAHGFIGGQRVPLLGRVTMDLIMFDVSTVSDQALAGGWIELIGANVPVDDLARAAGTIGYEVLTGLGHRFERIVSGATA